MSLTLERLKVLPTPTTQQLKNKINPTTLSNGQVVDNKYRLLLLHRYGASPPPMGLAMGLCGSSDPFGGGGPPSERCLYLLPWRRGVLQGCWSMNECLYNENE